MATQEFYPFTSGQSAVPAVTSGPTASAWPAAGDPSFWDASAPAGITRRYCDGNAADGWKQWRRHIRRRSGLLDQLTRKTAAGLLTWASSAAADDPHVAWLLDVLTGRGGKHAVEPAAASAQVQAWLTATDGLGPWHPAADEAWEAVLWAHALVPLARTLDGPVWWQLAARLLHLAVGSATSTDEDPLAHQLVAGELSWTLTRLLPELTSCRSLAGEAVRAISACATESLDGRGLIQRRLLELFRPLLASWTRCRLWCELSPGAAAADLCWNSEAEDQFPQAIREALRLSRHNGTPALLPADGESVTNCIQEWGIQELAQLAAERLLTKKDRRTVRALLPSFRAKKPSGRKQLAKGRLPQPSVHSEWAQLAVLQTAWSRRASRWSVAYGEQGVRVELESGRHVLVSGSWDWELRDDGVSVEPRGAWSEVCWLSDDNSDYLELEIPLTAGLRIQRQMLLARKDEFLFLADAVLGAAAAGGKPRELEYRARLPLAADVTAQAAEETRELMLHAAKKGTVPFFSADSEKGDSPPRAMVLPLALPEWRADPRGGSLAAVAGALELRQTSRGQNLLAPLWIDLAPQRYKRAYTWRQLTVGEQLQIQPRDVAVGYRVQFGKRQWLAYRALVQPGNRTLLGQNLSSEFFVGRFRRDGETEAVVEVE